ncbi:MAG TPA: DegT/DnrJ/EryC1/StrS family aminotransferase [Gemmataceae bacterium]|nr:DegT/DnrJ/EryC1/StrS family aminotransferase [Gemmataceae bacterium]
MTPLRYPCTGHVPHEGFGAFLERELGGPRVNLHRFAAELGRTFAAEHLTLVNSGSSANLAAALALAERVGRGAHAVTAGFTFSTTLAALQFAGFTLTVVDTEPGGFCIDVAAVRRALRPDTQVVCVTHFLGFPAAIDDLAALAAERRLLLLQDACESMDLRVAGAPAHHRGTLTTWSFYHPHHLPAFGGGVVVSPDTGWRQLVESLTHWGRACTCHYDPTICPSPPGMNHFFTYVRPGLNAEMSELNACFGRFQLRRWPEIEAQRRRHYETLSQALHTCPAVRVYPAPTDSGTPSAFPVTCTRERMADLVARLTERGVEARTLMGGAVIGQSPYRDLAHDGLRHCQAVSDSTFFVGIHQTLPEDDVVRVAAILTEEAAR